MDDYTPTEQALFELQAAATSDRAYMSDEGFDAAIAILRADAWDEGWVASESYTGRSAVPLNPYRSEKQ